MAKISNVSCFGLSLAISAPFTLEMCVQPEIAKNSPKLFGLRSFKVIDVDILKKLLVLVMISITSVSVCNHFHAKRANGGRITSF